MIRRGFLICATASVALSLVNGACAAESTADVLMRTPPSLSGALGASVVRALGRRYAEQTPAERTVGALQRAIDDTSRRNRRWPWSETLGIEQLIAKDFADGQTVFVDGWMLSLTEARHCALAALVGT